MGAWLNSLHVRGGAASVILDVLEAAAEEPGELVAREGDGWVSVYADPAVSLSGGEVSRALPDAPVLSVAVYDSDAARLQVWLAGERIATLASPAETFGVDAALDVDPLGPLLVDGSLDALRAIWDDDPLFAEDLIARTAPLLGLASSAAIASAVDFDDGVIRRDVGRPPEPRAPSGPTRLIRGGGPLDSADGVPGEPYSFFYTPENPGAPGRGLRVEVGGGAVEGGHVEVGAIRIGDGRGPGSPVELHRGERRVVGEAPALTVERPAVWVEGTYRRSGRGSLSVTLTPMDGEGRLSYRQSVHVLRDGRRPLRAADGFEGLRALWAEPAHLSAYVALPGAARAAAVRLASALVAILGHPGGARLRRSAHVPLKRPRDGFVACEKLTAAYLAKQLQGASHLSVALEDERHAVIDAVGIHVPGAELAEQDEALHVTFTAALGPRSLAERRRLGSALEAALDALARATALHQAFVARSSRAWIAAGELPYETACGVRGQCTERSAWVERWLRVVSPTVWLGPALASRVDRDALAAVAEVETLGAGVLRLRAAEEELDRLEAALAAILPGEADWEAGVAHLYGRGA